MNLRIQTYKGMIKKKRLKWFMFLLLLGSVQIRKGMLNGNYTLMTQGRYALNSKLLGWGWRFENLNCLEELIKQHEYNLTI